jgi:DNA repair exonuclease SbcCD ATPase subunit
MVDDELRSALDSIENQWNTAEAFIKKVERLRRGLVVGASINELRYAGRRLVEAYAASRDALQDPQKRTEAFDLLREVKNFCLRAQHDAVDAAVTYIDQALAKFEDEFGPDLLSDKFPDYISMKQSLQEISGIMSESREYRDRRDELYNNINSNLIDSLIDSYKRLETSQVVFTAVYVSKIKTEKRNTTRFLVTIGIAVIAAVFGLLNFLQT